MYGQAIDFWQEFSKSFDLKFWLKRKTFKSEFPN